MTIKFVIWQLRILYKSPIKMIRKTKCELDFPVFLLRVPAS